MELTEMEQRHYERLLRLVRFNRRRVAAGQMMREPRFFTTLRMWALAAREA